MSLTPTQKKKVRLSIGGYCRQAVSNEPRIHYSQQRPFHYYDNIGASWVVLDCSGFVANCFWNAMHDTLIFIHDVMDMRYTGIGNTSYLEDYLRHNGRWVNEDNGYLIGDVARWGQGLHAHTAICSKAGSGSASEWTSHGREGGPNVIRLHYRSDLVGVWRHPALL